MSGTRDRLERLLGGASLAGLRERLRRRYELGRSNGSFTVAALTPEERRVLEGLLGRRTRPARSIQVSVAELDRAIQHAELAGSFREALEQLDGPIPNLAAERAALAAGWEAVFTQCILQPLSRLVAEASGRGLVKRLAGGEPDRGQALLQAAASVLARLPQQGVPLSRVAAQVLGDAHALDEGRPTGTLVIAALRNRDEEERPREIWARCGVLVNELASPALALNLAAPPDTPAGRMAAEARALGEPIHLSLRIMLRQPPRWQLRGRTVFVCENPSIVALAADRFGERSAPLVCTDGMPSAAQRALLAQIAEAGAVLYYHGDFDWPGIAIGNFVMRRFGARPWRFSAADYDAASGRTLEGTPVAAQWDPSLAPKMVACGYALDEEARPDPLLDDLARCSAEMQGPP